MLDDPEPLLLVIGYIQNPEQPSAIAYIFAAIMECGLLVIQNLKQDLKNDLIAGLLVVIPLATTIWLSISLANWAVDYLTRIPKQLNPFDGMNPLLGNLLNLFVGFAVPLMSILLIGLMARNIAGRWLLDVGERVVQAIPLAGSVYKTLKQILETILKDSNSRFRRVVLVEYPRKGLWTLGFVTGNVGSEFQSQLTEKSLSVFFPTTPNPTSGWYSIVPEQDVITISMSVEDAFKVLVSGGIVTPSSSASPSLSSREKRILRPLDEIEPARMSSDDR